MMTDDTDNIGPEPSPPAPYGGSGDLGTPGQLLDPHHRRGDLDLILRAVRAHWPISAELRTRIVEALGSLALDVGARPAERVKASATLVTADRLNAERDRMATEADRPTGPAITVNIVPPDTGGALAEARALLASRPATVLALPAPCPGCGDPRGACPEGHGCRRPALQDRAGAPRLPPGDD